MILLFFTRDNHTVYFEIENINVVIIWLKIIWSFTVITENLYIKGKSQFSCRCDREWLSITSAILRRSEKLN